MFLFGDILDNQCMISQKSSVDHCEQTHSITVKNVSTSSSHGEYSLENCKIYPLKFNIFTDINDVFCCLLVSCRYSLRQRHRPKGNWPAQSVRWPKVPNWCVNGAGLRRVDEGHGPAHAADQPLRQHRHRRRPGSPLRVVDANCWRMRPTIRKPLRMHRLWKK